MIVEGLTIREIADILGIHYMAAKTRLRTANIEPESKAGKTNIYNKKVVKLIENVPDRGRPKITKKQLTKPKN